MKILVLGAGGMAGSTITKYLSSNFEVTPWYRQDYSAPDPLPDLSGYDFVINCIGIIKQKTATPDMMYSINSKFPLMLSKSCKKLIHISSDCVFSGKITEDQSYRTDDLKDAEDDYGKSKAIGENINAMILRTSIIGPSKDNSGLFEWFRNTKEPIVRGFYNHWWSGITTLELAKTIENFIRYDAYKTGVIQVASNKISKLDLLHLINSYWHLSKEIYPVASQEPINRVLVPDLKTIDISRQLFELREFIK